MHLSPQPLAHRRILVTRPRRLSPSPGDPLVAALTALGADAIWLPAIRIAPPDDPARLDAAIGRAEVGDFDWIVFTSANAVDPVLDRLPAPPPGIRVAAVGPATAAALEARGWPVDVVPPRHTAEALAAALGDVAGQRVLFPKADIARPAIEKDLAARGAIVDAVIAYRTLIAEPGPAALAELRAGVDVATFASGSAVWAFATLAGGRPVDLLGPARVACIGPETARVAMEAGLRVDILPDEHTIPALAAAIAAHFIAPDVGGPEAPGVFEPATHRSPT